MCRIAGILSPQLRLEDIVDRVTTMCRVLQHGGPDDEGIFSDKNTNVVFGHRRLSIIDLSIHGHQPMTDSQKKTWITFNGEIYNYIELKEQLIKYGARFHSTTDTEVILLAYLQWGTEAFSKLRGMFAFAIYDIENATTYLVRDTNGIKPLFYHINGMQLSFASEVKALKSAGIATETDDTWAIKFLAFGNIPEPYTTLKNVLHLPKGNFLKWNVNTGDFKIIPYSIEQVKNVITSKSQFEEYIRHSLSLAVKRQLIADAPIGVFLSGGIDSSIITLLANKQQALKLKTVSVFFDEKAYDESNYQNLVRDKLKVKNTPI